MAGRKPNLTTSQLVRLRNIQVAFGVGSSEEKAYLKAIVSERERGRVAKKGRERQKHRSDNLVHIREVKRIQYARKKDNEEFKAKRKEINARYWRKASSNEEWKKRHNARRKEMRDCDEFRKQHREYMKQYRQRKKENEGKQGTI